ncbi:MAG: sigma-70 family RNA polymerase sigma factor [Armatimonadetes bacterium]|nr:sigma-70 family RNA polymerase sigma factor [Armatimonadota bacterium]
MLVHDNLAISEVVESIANGDAKAWEILLGKGGRIAPVLERIAKHYKRCGGPSFEVHPQAILYEKMPPGHKRWQYVLKMPAEVVRSYIIAVLKHACLDQLAAQKKKKGWGAENDQKENDPVVDVEQLDWLPDSSLPVDKEYEKKELAVKLDAVLAKLSQYNHQRSEIIIRRHALQHETMEAVAESLGITRNNADQIRHRNIKKLKEIAPELESYI